VETWEGLGLDLVSHWKSNVSVSYHRVSVSYRMVSFTRQYAQLFTSLQNCTYIVLNARRLHHLLIHKLRSCLHPCCIHLQLQCRTQSKKSFFLTLLMQNLWSRLQSQLSEACLPQCRVETDNPISPDPSLFCTGSWFFWVQCASFDGKCCSLLSTLHRFATQQYYTMSQKNVPPLACYNFDTHEWILTFFWQKCYR